MASAAVKLDLHFNSFKRRALELGCYHVNQSGKGTKKSSPKIPLDDIITNGKYPHYQSYKLKKRLFEEGVKQPECEVCKISIWQNKPLPLELHHVDGNRHNHAIENLMLLCPNCHSQTPTFRAKNKKI
jgi:5-methylcytosine-specific restriction endonuclease McrA